MIECRISRLGHLAEIFIVPVQAASWGDDRYKSVVVQDGDALLNCLAYIDLNPIRAGMVDRPEEYRWCSLGYHVQTGNRGGLLSLEFGHADMGVEEEEDGSGYGREGT